MMPAINEVMLVISSSFVASIVIKVTVTMALGLLAVWLGRRNRAAIRHALVAATFGVILLLPIASAIMPPLHVSVPVEVENHAAIPLLVKVDANRSVTTAGAGNRVNPVAPQVSKLSLSRLLLAGWAAGAALFLLPVVIGLWQIRSLRRSGLPWRRGQSIVEALALDAGIHRPVEILLHEALLGPMTCGVVHPVIVLPGDAESWNQEDLNRAIVHELEHVRRGDSVSRCLARVAGAVYWFHPLVWIAWRRLVLEAERSCDDAVLRHSEATAYADQLIGLAKRLSVAQRSPLLAMANRVDLTTRVGAVLDSRQPRGRAGTFFLVLACVAAVALVFVLSPLTLVAAPQEPQPTFEVASVKHNMSGATGDHIRLLPGGRFEISNESLRTLTQNAFHVMPFQISGGPRWIDSERFDIVAKSEGDFSADGAFLRLRALLADRFSLKMHREMREESVYLLTLAKGGVKMEHAEGTCIPRDPQNPPQLKPGQRPPNYCGNMRRSSESLDAQGEPVTDSEGFTLRTLTGQLSSILGRAVLDKTGLTGIFNFRLQWTSDAVFTGAAAGVSAGDPIAPSIFTALQEQLGLKLESGKGPVPVLVIDSVEQPSDN